MGVAVSSSHAVSAAPSSSGGGLLILFPCSKVRSLSQETVLHKLLQRESFPWATALHELPQRGSFPQGAVLQEQAAPAWVPHGVTSPASKTLRCGLLSPRVCSSCQEPAPAWGSSQYNSFLQASTCSGVGFIAKATDGYLLHCGPPWSAGGQPASPWSFNMSCKGKLSAPASQALPPHSLFTHLGVCRVVSPLSSLPFHRCFFFLPLLKYVITEELPQSLIGLALASIGSILEPAGTGSIRYGGRF